MKALFETFNEQTYSRTAFMTKCMNASQEIMTNIGLIIYAKWYGTPQQKQLINHWSVELEALCDNIGYDVLKGNNSVKARTKALEQEFIKNGEWTTNKNMVHNKLRNKFRKEGIEIDEKFSLTIFRIMKTVPELIKVLADYSEYKIEQFIRNLN